MGDERGLGMLFLGMAIGVIIPRLPPPMDIVQPFVWVIFFIIGVLLWVRG